MRPFRCPPPVRPKKPKSFPTWLSLSEPRTASASGRVAAVMLRVLASDASALPVLESRLTFVSTWRIFCGFTRVAPRRPTSGAASSATSLAWRQ